MKMVSICNAHRSLGRFVWLSNVIVLWHTWRPFLDWLRRCGTWFDVGDIRGWWFRVCHLKELFVRSDSAATTGFSISFRRTDTDCLWALNSSFLYVTFPILLDPASMSLYLDEEITRNPDLWADRVKNSLKMTKAKLKKGWI